jgi:hypothetical protein
MLYSRPPALTSRCRLRCPRGAIGDPWRPRREGKRLPPREDGAVVLIDGELGRSPQRASKCNGVRTGVLHDQDRAGIMTPVEQYPSAVEEGLARYAKGFRFTLKVRIEQIRVSLPVRFDMWPDNDHERGRIDVRHFDFPANLSPRPAVGFCREP